MALGMKRELAMLDVEKMEILVVLTWERGSGMWALPVEWEGRWAYVLKAMSPSGAGTLAQNSSLLWP